MPLITLKINNKVEGTYDYSYASSSAIMTPAARSESKFTDTTTIYVDSRIEGLTYKFNGTVVTSPYAFQNFFEINCANGQVEPKVSFVIYKDDKELGQVLLGCTTFMVYNLTDKSMTLDFDGQPAPTNADALNQIKYTDGHTPQVIKITIA